MRGRLMCGTALIVLATAGTGEAAASDFELATGYAQNRLAEVGGPVDLGVAAYHRQGEPAHGHARGSGVLFPGGDFQVEGPVTCLRVEPKPALEGPGWRASIKYRFHRTSGSAAPQEGGGVEVFIEDNGHAVHGQPVDKNGTGPPLDPASFELTDPSQCDDPNLAGQPYNPVDRGDYTLRDDAP
jgi:hypothetical protein